MPGRILIIEDEERIARFVELELVHEGYEVDKCTDGRNGLEKAESGKYDLILLDIMLPGLNGLEVLRRLRRTSDVPVIMLTARDAVMDKVSGLDLGADDYITKPFSMEELTYRIDAIMHRVQGKKKNDEVIVTLGKFTFDRNKQILAIGDDKRKLTTKESELLNILYEHVNDVLPRELALNKIWEDDNRVYARSMDVYITKLRKYLKADPDVEILNVHGEGYKLVLPTA